jgi:hypothetical protein
MKRLLAVLIGALMLMTGSAGAADSAKALSKKEVKELLSKASTPQDHRRLAGHYEAKARQYEAEAADHAEMAKLLREQPTASEAKRPGAADTAAHCGAMAESLTRAAKDARAMAATHGRMAQQ